VQSEGADHKHDDSVTSVGFEVEGDCHLGRLNGWLSHLMMNQGVDLFRSKGILAIQGSDDKSVPQTLFAFRAVSAHCSIDNTGFDLEQENAAEVSEHDSLT